MKDVLNYSLPKANWDWMIAIHDLFNGVSAIIKGTLFGSKDFIGPVDIPNRRATSAGLAIDNKNQYSDH